MYRLLLYYLIGLLVIAFGLSILHQFSFTPMALILSTILFVISSWLTNTILAKIFHAQTNIESVYITALILSLIVTPVITLQGFIAIIFIAMFSIASKYVLTLKRKHIFNPAALGVWIVGLILGTNASWWVGTAWMLPFVIIGGLLIIKKIQREDMVFSFFAAAVVTCVGLSIAAGHNDLQTIFMKLFLETPLFFFAFVMLTEPLTTPPTKQLQIFYGILTGILFAPQFHIFVTYFSPEESLLIGNIYSYFVSPKTKLFLQLKEKIQVAPDIFDFIFQAPKQFSFVPGQYMEWTLAHAHPDSRGNRRYLTIASSPSEDTVRIGVRFNTPSSSFKKRLASLSPTEEIVASQISGDFMLPKDPNKKLVFLAGGIGITPFRSMIKYLLDTKQKRDIILFYTAKNPNEFAYKSVFDEAAEKLGIKVIYTITNKTNNATWKGRKGRIDTTMIEQEVLDYKDRLYYFSGPQAMITDFEKTLKDMGIPAKQIKKDFFPGFV